MRIFNFANDQNLKEPPSWVGKFTRRVADLFKDDGPQPQPDLRRNESVTDLTTDGTNQSVTVPISLKAQQTRKAVFQDIEQMDANDELVATALDILADCSVNFLDSESEERIKIETKDEKVLKILNEAIQRLDLNNDLWQIAREMVKHGSAFRENVIDRNQKDPKIINLKQTVAWTIWPNESPMGDKLPGWIQRTEQDAYTDGGQKLDEWQITPFMYGIKYGYLHVGPLAAARRNWMRIQKMEDGMAVARLTRAYDKQVHRIPVKENWTKDEIQGAIRRYKDSITKRRMSSGTDGTNINQGDMPFDAQTDFFLPDDGTKRGGVEILSGTNNQLMNLTDVYYLREKLLARLKVPIQFMQIMSTQKTHVSAGKGSPDTDLQFARTLKGIQSSIRRGLKRILDFELLLQGVLATDGLYEIKLCPIRVQDDAEQAKIELTLAQAAVYMSEAFGALPPEILAQKFLRLSDEQKAVLDKFLKAEGAQVFKAKVKAIEEAAKPKPVAGIGGAKTATGGKKIKDRVVGGDTGSGNNNKSRAARSSEQRGGAKQSVEVDTLVDIFVQVQTELEDDLRAQGHDIPEGNQMVMRQAIVNRLGEIAQEDEILLED
jgi:hypothetical protein